MSTRGDHLVHADRGFSTGGSALARLVAPAFAKVLDQIDRNLATGGLDATLPDGEKRRLEIGLALASSPSLLLLDEPLAGMSPRERVETVRLLKSIARGRTMIIIDHDMDSLFELAEHITVLHEGRILMEGTPAELKADARVQEAYLGGVHGELVS